MNGIAFTYQMGYDDGCRGCPPCPVLRHLSLCYWAGWLDGHKDWVAFVQLLCH